MSTVRMSCNVVVDFDGTIVTCDATDFLLERFADPSWHAVEDEWIAGRIGSRECLAKQTALLKATPAQIDTAIDELNIDPGFATFLGMCREHGIDVRIISDGFDRVIARVLDRHGLSLPFTANRLEAHGDDTWRLVFPHARADCRVRSGHCKCATARDSANRNTVVIGDGRSDFCVAGGADLVFAKSKLLELCQDAGLPHLSFESFFDIAEPLMGWLEAQGETRLDAASRGEAVG